MRKTPRGTRVARWYCPQSRTTFSLLPDCLAARLDATNKAVLDYYLLPLAILRINPIRLADTNGLMLDAFRFDTLDYFFAMAERARISELAA